MKTLFYSILGLLLPLWNTTFATGPKNILGTTDDSKLRNGDWTIDDIPKVLNGAATYLL